MGGIDFGASLPWRNAPMSGDVMAHVVGAELKAATPLLWLLVAEPPATEEGR